MVQLARLKSKRILLLIIIFTLCLLGAIPPFCQNFLPGSALHDSTNASSTVPKSPVYEPSLDPGPGLALAPILPPIYVLLRQLIEDCIEKVWDQVLAFPAKQDALNRYLKAWNLDVYYENTHIECYYSCHQCEDLFEIASAKDIIVFSLQCHSLKVSFFIVARNTRLGLNTIAQFFYLGWFKVFLRKSLKEFALFIDSI